MATMLVPKLTLPRIAKSAQIAHIDDEDVSKRNAAVLRDPIAAKARRSGLRWDAAEAKSTQDHFVHEYAHVGPQWHQRI